MPHKCQSPFPLPFTPSLSAMSDVEKLGYLTTRSDHLIILSGMQGRFETILKIESQITRHRKGEINNINLMAALHAFQFFILTKTVQGR